MYNEALFSLAALRSERDAAELGDAPAPDDEAPGAESDSEADAAAAAASAASGDEDSDDERRRAAICSAAPAALFCQLGFARIGHEVSSWWGAGKMLTRTIHITITLTKHNALATRRRRGLEQVVQ